MPKLNVPYRSQWAEDAASHSADCGPTCVAMLLNHYSIDFTPDEGYQVLSQRFSRNFGAHQYTLVSDLIKVCNHKGVGSNLLAMGDQGGAFYTLQKKIDQGIPIIALVNYKPWRAVTGNSFPGSHFVVVTGYDNEHIYLHDPLFGDEQPTEKGEHFKMTRSQFAAGWGGFNNPGGRNNPNGNYDWLLIYPNHAPVKSEKKASKPAVNQPDAVVTKPPKSTQSQPAKPSRPVSKPIQTSSPVPQLTDDVKRRVEALAGWHRLGFDWNDKPLSDAWLENLGEFGKVTQRHKVGAGDTLAGVSGQYYGQQDKWKAIMGYNRLPGEYLIAGQWIRIPMPGNDDAHTTIPDNDLIRMNTEAEEFHDPDVAAEAYETLAENSAAMGVIESAGVDDSEAAGFTSNPNVVTEDIISGQHFTGTWTFRNSGTTAWDSSYKMVYVPRSHPSTAGANMNQMALQSAYSIEEIGTDPLVLPGETLSVTVPLIAPAPSDTLIASHWQLQNTDGENFGALRWITAKVVAGTPPTPVVTSPVPPVQQPPAQGPNTGTPIIQPKPAPTKTVSFGMNINPNLDSTDSREIDYRDVDIENQKGLGWVRYVYWASRNQRGGKEAYVKRYRELIKTYADAGIKTLIILHQDTYWGNAPWSHGGWGVYAAAFGRECAEVAAACAEFSDMVAYQIYNETDSGWGDDAANPNKSAIGLPPDKYALILESASKSIRAVDPNATIVAGGMKTGPVNAVNYLKAVQAALHKPLPVDALAYHPYGRRAQSQFDFVPFGTLADAFRPFAEAFPSLPVWLTEIGVPGHQHVFPSDRYPEIQTFMNEAIGDFKTTHAAQVPVIIWFAWSDFSENSGIVTKDGRFKSGIVDAYQAMRYIS